MTVQNARNSLLEYMRLLTQVQYAIRDGDKETASFLRRQSEEIGDDLSPQEIEWLYGVSGDLDMLTGDEVFEHSTQSARSLLLALQAATTHMDGQTMLELLRQNPLLEQPQKAYLRANAYDYLGYTELSIVFMSYASELAPDDDQYICLILERLNRLQRFDDMALLASTSLNRSNPSEELTVFAAGSLFFYADKMQDGEARVIYQKAITALDPLLASPVSLTKLEPRMRTYAWLTLGCCSERIEDTTSARKAFSAILEDNPNNTEVLVLRGESSLEDDREKALLDFGKAVSLGARQPTPYLILAHEHLMEGRFLDCQDLCQKLLSLPNTPPRVTSMANEFLAISYFYTDQAADLVRVTFQKALDGNPTSQRLGHLAKLFLADLNAGRARFADLELSDLVQAELRNPEVSDVIIQEARADTSVISRRFISDSFSLVAVSA